MKKEPALQAANQQLSEQNKFTLILSMYTMINSQIFSSLNTISSIAIAANSAFAFMALSKGWGNLFSCSIAFFVFSIISYGCAIFSQHQMKKYIINISVNDVLIFHDTIVKVEKLVMIFIILSCISIVSPIMLFIFIDFAISGSAQPLKGLLQ